jgi:hypothetical protein
VQNFFASRSRLCRRGRERKIFRRNTAVVSNFIAMAKNCDSAETLDPSAFLRDVDFCAGNFARGKFFAAALRL